MAAAAVSPCVPESVALHILVFNWLDRLNPRAGGAEVHLREVFGRLARSGHHVTLVSTLLREVLVSIVGSPLTLVGARRVAEPLVSSPSPVPERGDRVDRRRTPRRPETGDQADRRQR